VFFFVSNRLEAFSGGGSNRNRVNLPYTTILSVCLSVLSPLGRTCLSAPLAIPEGSAQSLYPDEEWRRRRSSLSISCNHFQWGVEARRIEKKMRHLCRFAPF
jgi:hypothetical protein